jgi:hypothetical protein
VNFDEPQVPDLVTRTLLISFLLHDECVCAGTVKSDDKCSRCIILENLRHCWPTDYLAVADVMARKAHVK